MKKTIYLFGLILSIVYSSNIYSQCVTGDCNNGEGTYKYTTAKYWGNWKNGKREGYGVFEFDDASAIYKGNWSNDKRNGFGSFNWKGGASYEGNWVDDKRTGQGTYYWSDGNRFVGQFIDDNMTKNGVVTYYAIQKSCVSGDCYNGYGKFGYANSVYEGYFKNGKKEGKGKMIFWDGGTYEGDYVNDEMSGKGKFIFPSGGVYDGDWVNGNKTGKGIFIFGKGKGEGDRAEGDFINGYLTGYGKYTFLDGTIQEGKWLNWVFQGSEIIETKGQSNTQISSNPSNGSSSNYTFTKAPELKINYLDNRKMCCCCDQTYSQYKLRENVVIEEKIYYLTEKLAIFHQQNGNALLSETKNESQIQNDLSNLKSFLNTAYPGNQQFINFIAIDFHYNSFMSGVMIFNQGQNKTKPGSTERFVYKYEIISPFCSSLKCKNDEKCKYYKSCKD